MMGNNKSAGQPAFASLAKKPEVKPPEPAAPVDEQSEKIRKVAEKVAEGARRATDNKGLQNSPKPTKQVVMRSIQYSKEMYDKMTKLKKEKGPDYNWQVNKALEHWFKTVHSDI